MQDQPAVGQGTPSVHEMLARLESVLAELKSIPTPGFVDIYKAYLSIVFPLAALFSSGTETKDEKLSRVKAALERERRQVSLYYGDDTRIRGLLGDIDADLANYEVKFNQSKRTALILFACLLGFNLLLLLGSSLKVFLR